MTDTIPFLAILCAIVVLPILGILWRFRQVRRWGFRYQPKGRQIL